MTLAFADAQTEPTVLELEQLPGEGALVPPEWIPWRDRFAEYRAAHERERAEAEDAGDAAAAEAEADEG